MKPADLMREIAYPLTSMAIVMAMLFFWMMFNVAKLLVSMPGFIGIILALSLLFFLTPAYFRYLLFLLEARANGQQAPVPTGEMFALTNKLWSLTPLVLVALLIWGVIFLSDYGFILVLLYGIVFLLIAPASVAILAITHSPIESLNPWAIGRMFQVCGPPYFVAPVIVAVLAFLLALLNSMGVPKFIIELGTSYLTILMFTMTGGVLHMKGVVFNVDIGPPLEPTEKEIAGDLEKEREKVASHAYGFISRGNREGGFAHIMDWIQKEPDVHEALAWFFNAMMRWESKDAALFYAQTYISHLLHHDEDMKALKLISVCLHANPRWKPKAEDREHVLELVKKHQRDDLLRSLRN
jgi:hypothetical protein